MNERMELAIRDAIEEIQDTIITAGGGFIHRKELQDMTVRDLLLMVIPNVPSFHIVTDLPKEEKEIS